jgi:perosamine synthetase
MEMTSAGFIPFHLPLIQDDDIRAVCEVMKSGWITTGPRAVEFEQEFARYIGARDAIAVNSCTAALHVALEAAGVREGDEVILPTLTFAATAEAVVYLKARPVLTDCEPDTFNLDPKLVERAITPRTRAIVPVHFAGQPCDMDMLLYTARKHGLKVIEDAAHALPARYRGSMVGTLGDMTCFSFYATKNITTGEGGMVTTNSAPWADRMRIMRLHGISRDAWKRYTAEGSWKYEILAPGFKYNLTDMQAALGITQLAKCNMMWARRNELAQRYTEALSSLDAYEVPEVRADVQHAWHLYVLRICPGVLSIPRDQLIEELKQRGIGTSVHFIPLHTHPYYRDNWGYRPGDFPIAEDFFNRCVSLPLYPAMSDETQMRVIDALVDIASKHRRIADHAFTSSALTPSQLGSANDFSVNQDRHSQTAALDSNRAQVKRNSREWHQGMGKRVLDCVGAITGLLALSPAFAVCAAAVLIDSPGPALFRQNRVGKDGQIFNVLKFRTMKTGEQGPKITAAGDARVTAVGRLLRRWKLDELPQLINVLKGDMALVGPRPEVPEYVDTYTSSQKAILQLRPGLTSPASLTYIDEEDKLARQSSREEFYREVLLPHKLQLDLDYCRKASFSVDLKILLATLRRLLPARRGNAPDAGKDHPIARERTA